MRPLYRKPENRHSVARKFRKQSRRTKAPNMAPMPMRGGIRL